MAHRDFDKERAALDPISFTLGGKNFRCKRSVRPESILEYEGMDESISSAEALRVVDALISEIIVPEDVDDWRALRLARGEDELDLALLSDLAGWLVENVVNRPLAPASSSSASSTEPTTGTTSTDDSSSQAAVA